MQRRGRKRYKSGIKQLVINHISKNINIYFKVLIILIIGICIGIAIVNQLPETGLQNINEYLTNSINALKNNNEISKFQILKSSLFKNIVIVLIIWFLGLTLVGSFILYFITLIIGITFGYTLAAIMTSFTFLQGILFFSTAMLLQNIINIPSIIFLIVQGIKSHKDLISNQNTSIKYILAKHSAYSILVMLLLVLASLIEVYVSGNLVYSIVKYL
ncbi:MAG: stage II sporulation protein M [Clostridia bacterium]